MPFQRHNSNPCCYLVPDCVVRAICTATGESWHHVYTGLCVQGAVMCSMPSVNAVWGAYLNERGFPHYNIHDRCTVRQFAREHPRGVYVLGTGNHAVAVIDGGRYVDTWDSGNEQVLYYFVLEE